VQTACLELNIENVLQTACRAAWTKQVAHQRPIYKRP
jgi:hypothetical protein